MAYRRTGVGEKKREASIGRIVAAAKKLFAEKGFAHTTVHEIVEEAHSSVGNFYFYFDNKDELLQQLIADQLKVSFALGDEAAARAPRGPARLAAVLFTNAVTLWGPESSVVGFIGSLGDRAFTDAMLSQNTARIKARLEQNIDGLSGLELDLAAAAWGPSGLAMANVFGQQSPEERDMWRTAKFAARWNLRAVGVSDAEIDAAIDTAYAIVVELVRESTDGQGAQP